MIDGERTLGPTFPVTEVGFFDFETNSTANLKVTGATRYACDPSTSAIVCAYGLGHDPVRVVAIESGSNSKKLHWHNMPAEFRAFHARVVRGEAIWAAWNAGFDRAIWNYATDFPFMEVCNVIDPMAQAAAAGLPYDLFYASRAVHAKATKLKDGKRLIALFCNGSGATPESHPEDWRQFLHYALTDVEAMRSVFRRTLQLTLAEWREYWAMEQVNCRGVAVDLPMVEHAAKINAQNRRLIGGEIGGLTGGAVKTIDQVAVLTRWLLAQLPEGCEGIDILTKRPQELDDNGQEIKPPRYSLRRPQVERMLAWLKTAPPFEQLGVVQRLLELRLYGGSRTPGKFGKILAQHVDGVLYGQYAFNGAGQTGRASSRGVQVHNLTRDALAYEHEAVEALLAGCDYDAFATLHDDAPVSRKLSLLIRPALVPEGDNLFVWSDWSQIEARILPWLAEPDEPGAASRLQLFRNVDANPKLPDLYTVTASAISDIPTCNVTREIRQTGKVAELALGFGGSVQALQNMAASHGMHMDDDHAKLIVSRWRGANPWCVRFWGRYDALYSEGLWGAINRALNNPGSVQRAGRIHYVFKPDYFNGTLLCVLPSRRVLTYRSIKYETVADLDDDDKVIGYSTQLRFSRGVGRLKLWPGLATENCVQAVAADFLRGTIRRLEDACAFVRLHTHDEILLEVPESHVGRTAEVLHDIMCQGFAWSKGLPLKSEETISPYYSKAKP